MKKGVLLLGIFSLLIIISSSLISSAGNVSLGYECLEDKVVGKCSTLTSEEMAFSLMAINECKAELVSKAKSSECWAKTGSTCDLKTTAQSLIALDKTTFDTSKGADWLLAQKKPATGITWFLQIDAGEETSCEIRFDSGSYSVTIGDDKKIKTASGSSCFSKAPGDYWLQVSSSCPDKVFEVSCSLTSTDRFLTNLIYQKAGSDVFYVSETTNTAQSDGATIEEIRTFCFANGASCDYEGSLWAAMALSYLGHDDELVPFYPYLVTMAEDNEKFLPEAFLYYLKNDEQYKIQLLNDHFYSLKFNRGYWQGIATNDKVYDTALALFPLTSSDLLEKTKAQNWLLEEQGTNGCWGNNVRNTAFVLASAWPESAPEEPACFDNSDCNTATEKCFKSQCVPKDAECISDSQCTGGKICTSDYKCVECLYNSDCADDQICQTSTKTCVTPPECTNSSQCGAGEICSITGYCISEGTQCTTDSECTNGVCLNSTSTCVDCRTNSDCNATGYVCSLNNKCILATGSDCTNVSQCDSGEICDRGNCVSNQTLDCKGAGYFCRAGYSCVDDGGDYFSLTQYQNSCPYPQKCCTIAEDTETCNDKNGVVCTSDQDCSGSRISYTSGLSAGEICCLGVCEDQQTTESDCSLAGGTCSSSCSSSESEISDSCLDALDVCCVSSSTPSPSKKSYLWVWILLALILLVTLGIMFRDRLRMFFLRFKPGRDSGPRRPGFMPPPTTSLPFLRRPTQRMIIPSQGPRPMPSRPQPRPPVRPLRPQPKPLPKPAPSKPAPAKPQPKPAQPKPQSKPAPEKKEAKEDKELDEVIKKLKEIGK
jgi:Cys-rich repeat protein